MLIVFVLQMKHFIAN